MKIKGELAKRILNSVYGANATMRMKYGIYYETFGQFRNWEFELYPTKKAMKFAYDKQKKVFEKCGTEYVLIKFKVI